MAGDAEPRDVSVGSSHLPARHPTRVEHPPCSAESLSRSQGEDEQERISWGRFLERGRESCVLVLLQELLRHLQ